MGETWIYNLPTKVVFGVGSIEKISDIVKPLNSRKIFLVTGKQSMRVSGLTSQILLKLNAHKVFVYDKVGHNPLASEVEEGVAVLRNEKSDLVIGLGGGSVIDFAKSIAIFSQNSNLMSDCLVKNYEIANEGLPVIAIPTTAGTGSEVTQYASIVHEGLKKKISLTHDFCRPRIAVVDPSLTLTLPKFVTATTGMDALSQCIEAYWSKNHMPISDLFALAGIKLVFDNLLNACNFQENIEFRINLSLASLYSGIAISIAKTTIVHSVSYPLTVHFGVPHGLACSLTLPSFIRFNSGTDQNRVLTMANEVGYKTIEEFVLKIEEIISGAKLPTRLSGVGIKSENIDLIIKEGFRSDRAANNPKEVKANDLKEILSSIM